MRLFLIRIRQMIIKEFRQALRDPRMRIMIFLPPVGMLIIFGYAVNLDLDNIPAAIYDADNTSVSRDLASAFSSSGYFNFKYRVSDSRELADLIDRGKVKAALHFESGLAGRIKSGRTAAIQVIVSGTDSNTAATVQSYTVQIVQGYNQKLLKNRIDLNPVMSQVLPSGVGGIIQPRLRVWYNPNLASANFYVPGVIGMIIMIITLILTGMSVVREKEIGTMEQIMVTPLRPVEFILGKTVPFGLIGLIQVTLVTTVGVLWFKVPMRGSLLLLGVSLIIYLLSSLSLGLLISTISRTQQQALITTFFFVFPAILLSGFVFPIANMPWVIQLITYLNPLRYALVIIRGIFLKGVGLEVLWPQVGALLIVGLCLMTLAVTRVRKKLE